MMKFYCFFIRSKKSSLKWYTKGPLSISIRIWFQWLKFKRRTFCMSFARLRKWFVWISKRSSKKWTSLRLMFSIQLPRCLIWKELLLLDKSIFLRIMSWSRELVYSNWHQNLIQFVNRLSKRLRLFMDQSVQMDKFSFWTVINQSRNSQTITMDRIDFSALRLRIRRSILCSRKLVWFQTFCSFISLTKLWLSKTQPQPSPSYMDPTWNQIT